MTFTREQRSQVHREYLRLRAKDWTASAAWHAAKIKVAFAAEGGFWCAIEDEPDGLVKLVLEPDQLMYDDSFLTGMYGSKEKEDAARRELWDRIQRDGVWVASSWFRLSEKHPWELADSVGGFVGDDVVDSGHDTDLMESALECLDDERQREADKLAERATYAMMHPQLMGARRREYP